MGLQRTHAQLLGCHERLTIVDLGALDLGGILMHGDLAKEPQGLGEASALSSLLREVPRAQGHLGCLVQPAGHEIRLTGSQVHTRHRIHPRFRELPRRTLIQQGQRSGDPPQVGVRVAQGRGGPENEGETSHLAEVCATFEV